MIFNTTCSFIPRQKHWSWWRCRIKIFCLAAVYPWRTIILIRERELIVLTACAPHPWRGGPNLWFTKVALHSWAHFTVPLSPHPLCPPTHSCWLRHIKKKKKRKHIHHRVTGVFHSIRCKKEEKLHRRDMWNEMQANFPLHKTQKKVAFNLLYSNIYLGNTFYNTAQSNWILNCNRIYALSALCSAPTTK